MFMLWEPEGESERVKETSQPGWLNAQRAPTHPHGTRVGHVSVSGLF